MGKDDQIAALNRRNKKDRDDHAKTMAAKNEQLRALRESWELLDTFPALENFLRWLHKIRDASGPLRSASYDSRSAPGFGDPTGEAARRPNGDRRRIADVNKSLAHWTEKLEEKLGPKGPLVDEEIQDTDPRPRCNNPECPARLIPQAFDQEICHECKIAFTEFRPLASKRCWTRGCEYRGKTGQCQHSQSK